MLEMTRLHTFLHWLHVFASSFNWFTGLSVFFMTGQSEYFVLSVTTFI